MIGEIIQLDVTHGVGRIRAQGNAGTFVFGLEATRHLRVRVGDIVSFSPHKVGDTTIALAIQAEDSVADGPPR